jgi:hypothetical protein
MDPISLLQFQDRREVGDPFLRGSIFGSIETIHASKLALRTPSIWDRFLVKHAHILSTHERLGREIRKMVSRDFEFVNDLDASRGLE